MKESEIGIQFSRREVLAAGAGALAGAALPSFAAGAKSAPGPMPSDRVFITNEDSCTLSVIDPVTDQITATVNLTSFDEDARPPFRFITGGVIPTHGAMIQKPLYHGAISIHGCAPSPDSRLLAVCGRGSSNLYFIDSASLRIIGNQPNPKASTDVNPETLTSGVFIGREPHEPTFTPTGKEVWVAVRGENRIAVVDVAIALDECAGKAARGSSLKPFIDTVPGPSMVWFAEGGRLAVVASQKSSLIDVFTVDYNASGQSRIVARRTIDIADRDPFGFSPFLKRSPNGNEIWVTHKLADRVSGMLIASGGVTPVDNIALGEKARPNHIEFVENANGRAIYVSFARIDDNGPSGVASSRIAIINADHAPGKRKVVGDFFSHGRDSHGMWVDPSSRKLYVAHEGDELPETPNAGQTVCSVFDVSLPFAPRFLRQIPIGDLQLPSGALRNKKSINLVYVRPGARSATAADG